MGVPTLWRELEAAEEKDTILGLSTLKFKASPGVRGLRLGIDASLWLFHARKMTAMDANEVGVNAGIRNHFYRIADLVSQGCLLLFIFDGPGKPHWKRGQRVGGGFGTTNNKEDVLMRKLIEVWGMKWKQAPGEAEAELAAMASRGELDAVLTDDVDTLLFGAPLIIRNATKSGKSAEISSSSSEIAVGGSSSSQPAASSSSGSKDVRRIYSSLNVLETLQLDREALILVALLSGGDYCPQGMLRVGPKIACALARCGFAHSLLKGLKLHPDESAEQKTYLDQWRCDVAEELRTDSRKEMGRKAPKLASELVGKVDFPDVSIVRYYTEPKVSSGVAPPTWNAEIDVSELVAFCSKTFEWGNVELRARFRSLVYRPLLMLELRRRAVHEDGNSDRVIPEVPYRSSYDESLFAEVRDLKNADSTLNVLSYRVTLNPTPLAKLVDQALPESDPYPIPASAAAPTGNDVLDPASSPVKTRRMPKDYGDSISPFTHWIPVAFVESHPDGRAAIEKWKEKKLTGSPKKKKKATTMGKLGFKATKAGLEIPSKASAVGGGSDVRKFFSPTPSPTKKTKTKDVFKDVIDDDPTDEESDGDLPDPKTIARPKRSKASARTTKACPTSPTTRRKVLMPWAVDDESEEDGDDDVLEVIELTNGKSAPSRLTTSSRESGRKVLEDRQRWGKCETLELSP